MTVSLNEVTKIEVYKGTTYAASGSYVVCIVFYSGQKIIAAPKAAAYTSNCNDLNTLKSNFIDKCPGNGYKCEQTYEIAEGKKLIGFDYELPKNHPSWNMLVLPDIKPIIIDSNEMWSSPLNYSLR